MTWWDASLCGRFSPAISLPRKLKIFFCFVVNLSACHPVEPKARGRKDDITEEFNRREQEVTITPFLGPRRRIPDFSHGSI
jgi:hypothetical protein